MSQGRVQPEELRLLIESVVEHLINVLDTLQGDVDLEEEENEAEVDVDISPTTLNRELKPPRSA